MFSAPVALRRIPGKSKFDDDDALSPGVDGVGSLGRWRKRGDVTDVEERAWGNVLVEVAGHLLRSRRLEESWGMVDKPLRWVDDNSTPKFLNQDGLI
jgi:hypothetical protein